MKLWACCRWHDDKPWDLIGVFSSEEKARAECRDWTYCVAPIDADVADHGHAPLPGAYYPIVRSAGAAA